MRTAPCKLSNGLKVSVQNVGQPAEEKLLTDFMLRETTAADHIDAGEAGEKLVYTQEKGHQFVQSPMLVGLELLRRQVVSYGHLNGPISMVELRKLSSVDLAMLQQAAQELDNASLEVVLQRGRDGAGGEKH